MHISLIKHKSQIQNSLNNIFFIDFKVVIKILPILFGIYKTLYVKYNASSFSSTNEKIFLSCFQNTLPGVYVQDTKISWQTFDQIFFDQLKIKNPSPEGWSQTAPVSTQQKIDFYSNSIRITPPSNWNKKQKKLYLGLFNNKIKPVFLKKTEENAFRYQIGNNWSSISAKKRINYSTQFEPNSISRLQNQDTVRNEIYSNLDELPLKLNSIYLKTYKEGCNLQVSNDSITTDIKDNKKSYEFARDDLFSLRIQRNTFDVAIFSKKKIVKLQEKKFKPIKIQKFTNFFLMQKKDTSSKEPTLLFPNCKTNYLQGITFTDLEVKSDILNIPETVFFLNRENKKSDYLENFIKQYSLNLNITPLANFESLNITSTGIVNVKNTCVNVLDVKNSSIYIFNSKESLELLKLIEKFIIVDKNIDIAPRIMSGYILPDSNNTSTLFKLKKINRLSKPSKFDLFPNNANKKIEVSKNYFNCIDFSKLNLNQSYFKLLSKKIELNDKKSFRLEGYSVFQNKTTNEVEINEPAQAKKWLKQLIYSDNPLTDRQENFFGNSFIKTTPILEDFDFNPFPEISIKKPLFLKKKSLKSFTTGLYPKNKINSIFFKKFGQQSWPNLLRWKKLYRIKFKSTQMFSKSRLQYIAYLNTFEWDTFIDKLKMYKIDKLDNEVDIEEIFPMKSIYQPADQFISWPLNQLDYKQNFNFLSQSKLQNFHTGNDIYKYHYFPYSQSLTKSILPKNFFFGKKYKRNNTIYKNKNSQQLFSQSFEPINYDSWLVLTQFSMYFFCLSIFKNIFQSYEQEIKSFLLSFTGKTVGHNKNDKNHLQSKFRIIKNIKKNFDDIAGIDTILPELGEIVWFLRNSGRFFRGSGKPQAILLTGPPGTGKTLLVQAIAGEAKVPVLIESANSLIQLKKSGSQRIKNLFQKAREIAPCIIFIDEIDTFGEARSVVMENPVFNNCILDAIYPTNQKFNTSLTLSGNHNLISQRKIKQSEIYDSGINESSNQRLESSSIYQSSVQPENQLTRLKANLLTQFLIELDGVANEKKVLVFAATNRPQILDSALTRPGRFNKTFDLKLPNKQKRVEIIKLYSGNIGTKKNINWNYLANLTIGFSAADLASLINQSSIQAIQDETTHTIETIEFGVQGITGYRTQKNKLKSFLNQRVKSNIRSIEVTKKSGKQLFINRIAYYQAGKVVVHTLLKNHPAIISIHLWPEVKSSRYHLMLGIREKQFSQIYRRIELESRVIGFYGGKAGEFLGLFHLILRFQETHPLVGNSKLQISNFLAGIEQSEVRNFGNKKRNNVNKHQQEALAKNFLGVCESNLSMEDISFASWLVELMVNKWYLYSKKISTQNFNQLEKNYNTNDDIEENKLTHFLQKKSDSLYQNSQSEEKRKNFIIKPWLQKKVLKKFQFLYSNKNTWYRIYNSSHEGNENTWYLSPDIYYHSNAYLNNLNHYKFKNTKIFIKTKSFSIVNWNDISSLNRDYVYHNLITTCFNKAILIVNENRELLDLFATSLIQKEILREYEILDTIRIFHKNSFVSSSAISMQVVKSDQQFENSVKLNIKKKSNNIKSNDKFIVLQKPWSMQSRRKLCKFINFTSLLNSKK